MSAASTTAAPKSDGMSGIAKRARANLQTYAILLALILIWIFFWWRTDGAFLAPQNFSNLFRQMTVTSFLAIGMVLIIVTGGIDLSVGKLAGFVSVMAAYAQASVWPKVIPGQEVLAAILSILFGILVGVLWEAGQGAIIAYLRVPSFIVTLGGMWILNGLILLRTGGKTIPANQPTFSVIAQGYLPAIVGWILAAIVVAALFYSMVSGRRKKRRYGFELNPLYLDLLKTLLFAGLVVVFVYMVNKYNGLPIPVLLLILAAVIMAYISNNTRFGRYSYAIGGNREAARLSGVNIRRTVFIIFLLMGLLAGIAGVVLASYVGYGTIAAGTGYELDAIAACILGGTSTLGGEGTVLGAMIGALIMASLTNGLQLLNAPPALQYVIKGIVLVLAVYLDVSLKKRR
jgi:D-xylose transport system permease protein